MVTEQALRRFDKPGPRYTSYPTAVEFHEGVGEVEYRAKLSAACLWDSNLFPGRAPDGRILMRAMIGGAHDPEAVALGDDELIAIVREDLGTTMGLRAEPILTRVYRHRTGIAQYTVGHRTRLDRIEATLRGLPGLWVAGSSYYGVSMNVCIQKAAEQANEVLGVLSG